MRIFDMYTEGRYVVSTYEGEYPTTWTRRHPGSKEPAASDLLSRSGG